jgi:hypothetical protein
MKVHAPTTDTYFVVVDVICDCCGYSCKTEKGFEFMNLNTRWDKTKITAHLCRKCVENKLSFIHFKRETWENPNTNQF